MAGVIDESPKISRSGASTDTSKRVTFCSASLKVIYQTSAEFITFTPTHPSVRQWSIPISYKRASCGPPFPLLQWPTLLSQNFHPARPILQVRYSAGKLRATSRVVLIRATAETADAYTPVWMIIATSVIVIPAAFYLRSELRYRRGKRTAAIFSTRLAPMVTGKNLFRTDRIAALPEAHMIGYIGEFGTCFLEVYRGVI